MGLAAAFTVYSTQNAQQRALAVRFATLVRTTSPGLRLYSRQLDLREDDGTSDTFRTDNWYAALVQKVRYWAEVAEAFPGQLVLCSDNDVSLLPGWRTALAHACEESLTFCFQREGGDDPFFTAFPYNSGFFTMRGSAQAGANIPATSAPYQR